MKKTIRKGRREITRKQEKNRNGWMFEKEEEVTKDKGKVGKERREK